MSSKEPIFSDIDLSFKIHPISKDIFKKTNEEAVKQSIKNLVKTSFYEIPFQSNIGTYINSALFELITPITAIMVKKSIEHILISYEPRISLSYIDIEINEENNSMEIIIGYTILGSIINQTVQMTIERLR